MKRFTTLLVASALLLGAAACSDDDGEDVRDSDSASESGSASGSASGNASASGSASASGGAVCDPFGNLADADSTVNVTLSEFAIVTDQPSAPAGKIHFAIENAGAEVHELVVVRAESIDALPLDDEGVLDEAAFADGDFIGEVEGFPAGQTCDGTFELTAGDYVLLCAIVEDHDGETENHLTEGMAIEFTVA